jgi:hypothetical protein
LAESEISSSLAGILNALTNPNIYIYCWGSIFWYTEKSKSNIRINSRNFRFSNINSCRKFRWDWRN